MESRKKVKKKNLLYPDLSYKVVGALFDVFNELGHGYKEKYYQRALQERLKEISIPFESQVRFPLKYRGKKIGWQTADFLIDEKIILARFSSSGLMYRRILSPNNL